MEIVIPIVEKIVVYTFKPVGQWLCYSFHYNSNMKNLKNQEEPLQNAKNRVQHSVDDASRNGKEIEDDVKTWLKKVDQVTRKLSEIEEEVGKGSSNAACLNLKHRHQLSREAKKMLENIDQLLKTANFDRVSYPSASEGMEMTKNMDYMVIESRMTAVKGIMEALGNTDIDKIGVWGMPGVGKSTLMKEIARQARDEKLFDEVVMAVVTDNPDVRRIQEKIAFTLGLNFDQEFEEGRANQLKQRLSKDKKILVILDDIWKELDLQEIGIPSEGCKVVMTSRDRDVLICKMGARKEIELKILQEAEACNLIEKMAGDSFKDQPEVRAIATEIAKKCEGLPIALVTVSKALKNKGLSEWKDTLRRLKSPAPEHITKMLKTIYTPIEVSYDSLESQELKSLFLLCAQLPYFLDYRDLLKYSYGYGLCHGINTLEDARDTLDTLLRKLKDSCLLLESSEEFYMHDLVRDVAIIIASKNHNMIVMRDDGGQKAWPDVDALNRCEALSIHGGEIHEHPNKMECPKLRFFHVNFKDSRNLKISDIFFQGMDKLEVLSLRRMRLSSLFPLTNLQTLCLNGCGLGDIHWIGELKTLVILSLAYSAISNLPREMESLTRLRLLDLTLCYELRVIAPNVLSSLVNLEELYMRGIKVQWEVEGPGNEGKNASLAELKKLSQLTTLEIDIPNANNLPANLFHEKLKRYKICIGDEIYNLVFTREAAFSRVLKLNLNMSFQLDFGIKMLLKGTEYLSLDEANRTKSVLYEVDREDFQQLKHLHIQNNGNIKHIPELGTSDVAFPTLEAFVLKNMFNLEGICQGKLPFSTFKNLKVLVVENCEKLRFIFSSSIARGLSLLEELNITRCNNMGAIVVKEEKDGIEDQGDTMSFDRLQTLVLKDLPKLVGFLSTKDSFMTDCGETNSEGNHDLQWPLLHHDQVSFPSLQTLLMKGLPKIKYVWSCGQEPKTVIRCLEQLQVLEIEDCGVEEIVAVEGGGEAGAIRTLVFPQVIELKFINLPRLKWFCKGVHVSKWPMLEEMEIEECENVEIFASEVMSFQETVKDQRQYEMSNIKQPLFLVDEHSFPSLKTLKISNMDLLEFIFGKLEGQNGKESQDLISPASGTEESGASTHFVSTGKLPLICFKNLKVLEVENYQKLRFLFSSSIVRGLSLLEKLKIKRCNNMGAIVVAEDKDGIEDGDVILFHQLQTLVLEDLPELVSFLSTKSSFMTDCGQIIAEGNHNLHMPLLHHQVSFPSLQTLCMKNLPKIKHVWSYDQEPQTMFRFQALQDIYVGKCESLTSLFPAWVLRCLEQLQVLEIEDCGVEEIVAIERGGEAVAIRTLVFPQVTQLKFRNLPKLKWFYKGVHVSKWPMLKEMTIERCKKVEIFASEVGSFEKAVKDQRQFEMSNIKQLLFSVDELSFPSLKKLDISSMDKLEIIWQDQVAATSFPNIPNANNLPANFFSEKLERYRICIGVPSYYGSFMGELGLSRVLKLKLNLSFQLDVGIKMLMKRTEFLYLDEENSSKSVLYEVDREDFQQLKHLHIQNNDNIKHILESGTSVVAFPILETFVLKNMISLVEICQGNLPLESFKNLTVLKVDNCEKLRFIFSSSIARGLSLLKELMITRCNNFGAIFMKEEEDGIEDQGDMMLFGRLQTLVLRDLPKLVGFLSTKDSFMPDCRETNSEDNHDLQLPLLRHDQVSFPSLQTLRMKGLPKIKYVWSCGQEPKTVIRCLEQLQVLEIEDCGVEEIVAFERGGEAVAVRTLMFPQVTKLKFRNLPRLKWFYKGGHVSKWPMLKEMEIVRCEKVEIFASGVVSFEKTVKDQRQSEMSIKQPLFSMDEHSFPSLETLEFLNMDSLEIIFGKLEGQNGKEPQVLISPGSGTEESGATTHFVSTLSFPSLKKLHIWKMDKLEIIWQDQVAATSFSNIQELIIVECAKLLHVFQSNLHTTTTLMQSLNSLRITDCDSLETIFRNMEGQNGKESQVLTAPSSGLEESIVREDGTTRHIEFPTLTKLSFVGLPKLKWIFKGVHTNLECPSLKQLKLGGFGRVINMIWASKFSRSSRSQENQLQTCVQQPIFEFDEATFPNLEILSLRFSRTICPSRFSDFPAGPSFPIIRLPTLLELKVRSSRWEEIFSHELVDREIRLRRLSLNHLPMLIHLWKEDGTQPCPLSHNLQILSLSGCGKLKNLVPSSVSLHNLTYLLISSCHGLINLLTSSTAKTLVQLRRMTVTDCKRITEIVAMEDGEANVEITFKKLTYLELDGLPNLTHFGSGPYSFGFPSLDEVIVRCCPEMKTFSHGVLSTPKLKGVYDDCNRWNSKRNLHWEDDLNTTTRCLWESNQYDTQCLFRERVENSEEDEDHP